jgi:hypothetical protein
MNTPIRSARVSALLLLAAAACSAHAENTESGGGPIDFGAPATVYIGAPGLGSDGGATPPLAQQDLGPPALVSITAPSADYNDGATGDIRLARGEKRNAYAAVAPAMRGTR